MKFVSRLRHPVQSVQNFLNRKYPPPKERVKQMARAQGLAVDNQSAGAGRDGSNQKSAAQKNPGPPPKSAFVPAKHYARVAPGAKCRTVFHRVRGCLEQMQVPYFLGGGRDAWCECINIMEAEFAAACQILCVFFDNDADVGVRFEDGAVASLSELKRRIALQGVIAFTIVCIEQRSETIPSTVASASWIVVNPWKALSSYSSDPTFESQIVNPYAKRIRKHTLDKLCDGRLDIAAMEPAVRGEMPFPIDIVYTWVDGSDENWKAIKAQYAEAGMKKGTFAGDGGVEALLEQGDASSQEADSGSEDSGDPLSDQPAADEFANTPASLEDEDAGDEKSEPAEAAEASDFDLVGGVGRAHHDERFRNRDELRYSLRSIEMFAPFVRHIYLVTNGQVPEWLDTSNERITVVTHEQIYSKKRHLPTFNSSGIETQLHHVKGLSEHFLYFNDDFFLGDFCTPSDFFLANGVARYFPSDQRMFPMDTNETSEEYLIADFNASELLKKKYGAFTCEIMQHVPYPSRKSFLAKLEKEFQKEFDACAAARFRSPRDLRPIAFMQYHAGLQEGLTVPSKISHRYLALWKLNIAKQLASVASKRSYKTFCINDVGIPDEQLDTVNRAVGEFLETYFPFKSSFEK